jgi:hypothetical protein
MTHLLETGAALAGRSGARMRPRIDGVGIDTIEAAAIVFRDRMGARVSESEAGGVVGAPATAPADGPVFATKVQNQP